MGYLSGFDLDIDGMGAAVDGAVKDGELLLDAPVEFSVVLVAAAGRDQDAVGELLEEPGDRLGALAGLVEEVQAEFQELFARFRFAAGVLQERTDVWHAQRNTDAGKRPRLRHFKKKTTQNNTGAPDFRRGKLPKSWGPPEG